MLSAPEVQPKHLSGRLLPLPMAGEGWGEGCGGAGCDAALRSK